MTRPRGAVPGAVPVGLVVGGLGQGGAERQLYYLATGLDRTRFEPTVFCLSEHLLPYGPRLEAAGVTVVALRRRGHFDFGRVASLGREARRRRVRILHAFLLDGSVYAALASGLAGRPVLISSNRVCLRERHPLRKALDRWALRRSDAVVVNSEEVLRFTRDHYGIAERSLRRIYNGLDAAPFAAAPRDPAVRSQLGAGPEDLLVVTIGRLEPQKNPGLFLRVAAALAPAEPRARFAWVGEGSEAGRMQEEAGRMGLLDRLRLAGGRADIAAVLAAADLFMLTSAAEGLPNVVLEAMAAERAVVATDLGGTREALGDAGVLCAPGDAGALAEAARTLLADPQARGDLGRRGRRRVVQEFPLERMVRETERLYRECLQRRAPRAGRRAA